MPWISIDQLFSECIIWNHCLLKTKCTKFTRITLSQRNIMTFHSGIQPLIIVENFCGEEVHTDRIESIQYRALKVIYNDFDSSYDKLLTRPELPTLELFRKRATLVEVYKTVNKLSPSFMCELFDEKDVKYNLRNCNNICVKQCRTKKYGQDSLSNYGDKLRNALPHELKMLYLFCITLY